MTEHPKDETDHDDRHPQHPGGTPTPDGQESADQESQGQVSEGPNSLSGSEADLGGADAVPDKTTGPGTSNQQD